MWLKKIKVTKLNKVNKCSLYKIILTTNGYTHAGVQYQAKQTRQSEENSEKRVKAILNNGRCVLFFTMLKTMFRLCRNPKRQ
jgi:hypothetical protein